MNSRIIKSVSASASDVGNHRKINEDSTLVDEDLGLWIVADGMGGYEKGDIASKIAVETVHHQIKSGAQLKPAIKQAHIAIHKQIDTGDNSKSGTTIVALKITGAAFKVCWAGDSRAYIFKNSKLQQITKDHTYVQYLLDQNKITKEQALVSPKRHMLTSGLGVAFEKIPELEQIEQKLEGDEIFILCSDGLYNEISDQRLKQVLQDDTNLEAKVDQLISEVLATEARDNVSVVIIKTENARRQKNNISIMDLFLICTGIIFAVFIFYFLNSK